MTVVWLVIIGVETVHGVVRSVLLAPYAGDLRSRQIGVLTGSCLILWVAIATEGWRRANRLRVQIATGAIWLLLTIAFEFCLGYYVLGLPWQRLTADYDIARGGLLPFGLAALALSPLIAARLRKRRDGIRGR